MMDTGGEAVLKGGRALGDEMADPSKAAKWASETLLGTGAAETPEMTQMTTNIARTLEGDANMALQVPQIQGLSDDSQEAADAADNATTGSSILGGITTASDLLPTKS